MTELPLLVEKLKGVELMELSGIFGIAIRFVSGAGSTYAGDMSGEEVRRFLGVDILMGVDV